VKLSVSVLVAGDVVHAEEASAMTPTRKTKATMRRIEAGVNGRSVR
jgi:hypothetical protein